MLGLRWTDLDLDRGRAAVRRTVISVGYSIRFESPKTRRARRVVALDANTVGVLREHRKRQLEQRLALGGHYKENDLVFCRPNGATIHPQVFSDRFERLVEASGLPRIRLHDLRHTHASLALQAGVHPKVVSERLGHASVSFTLDVYSHAIPAMQEDAAGMIARLVLGSER